MEETFLHFLKNLAVLEEVEDIPGRAESVVQ
jgi:hypothetical protein